MLDCSVTETTDVSPTEVQFEVTHLRGERFHRFETSGLTTTDTERSRHDPNSNTKRARIINI